MATEVITIKVGTNLNRTEVATTTDKTLRNILEEQEINYARASVFVDGVNIKVGDMDKTLEQLNIKSGAYIIAAQKTENA